MLLRILRTRNLKSLGTCIYGQVTFIKPGHIPLPLLKVFLYTFSPYKECEALRQQKSGLLKCHLFYFSKNDFHLALKFALLENNLPNSM